MTYGFSFECTGREAFIDELLVIAEQRGKGIGGKAIQHAVGHAKKIGIKMIRLEVTKTNPEAMNLYLRSGFEDWSRTLLAMPIDRDECSGGYTFRITRKSNRFVISLSAD